MLRADCRKQMDDVVVVHHLLIKEIAQHFDKLGNGRTVDDSFDGLRIKLSPRSENLTYPDLTFHRLIS